MIKSILILLLLIPSLSMSQVTTNSSLIFVGSDSLSHQVEDLGLPVANENAVSTTAVSESYFQYFTASGINSLSFTLPVPLTAYSEGMTFMFKATATNTDSVSINIDGLGPKRLLDERYKKLHSGNVQAGNIYKIVYSGLDFILLSDADKGCLNGFVEVNDSYCIEINEHSATLYYDASIYCNNIHAQLCTWGEWYYACQKSGLGLNALTNNWEFIDDAHDHGGFVGLVHGSSACKLFTSLDATTTNNAYRCCYRK